MKIAVLLPNSTTHKQLGYDFYLGLQYALAYRQISVEWMSASIGFGVDEDDMRSKAEDLLLNKGADVLLAFADYPKVSCLFPLLEAMNKELLVVNMGAKLPVSWEPHPLVFHLNLQESLISHMGGYMLREEGVGTVTLAANYYEGGYAPCQLIIDSFMKEGGTIDYNFIPQAKGQHFSIAPLTAFLADTENEAMVIASYSNPLTEVFLTQWREGKTGNVDKSLWCSSTLLMDALAQDPALLGTATSGILAWYRELDTAENLVFVHEFERKLNRKATFSAALGWDAGLFLKKAISMAKENDRFSLKSIMEVQNGSIALTLGEARLDATFNTVVAPAYRLSIDGNNQWRYQTIAAEQMLEQWLDLKLMHTVPNQNGWFNTYLCS